MNSDEGKIGFSLELDDAKLKRQIADSGKQFQQLADQVESDGARMDNAISGIGSAVASLGLAWSMQSFAKEVANVRGEFQKLQVAMETMLQSKSKAEALMAQMVQTAATTPFGLQEVAGGAKQLLAYGMEAEKVNETLIRLGDIAAGLSIPLGDLVYLYGTTMTQGRLYTQDFNQFVGRGIPLVSELAKQLGVAENKVKGLVEEGKVGFPEIQKVIENLTNAGGTFGGLMEKQSQTISGQISNIEDSFDMMFNEIGQNNEGIINDALSATSLLVDNYKQVAEAIGTLVAAYGVYKATLMTMTAYTNAAYSYEIAQLKAVLAEKGAEIDADLATAVSKGRMSAARAQEVQALRAELAAKIENAKAIAIEAEAEAGSATRKRMLAQLAYQKARAEVEAKQEEIFAMEGLYAHETAETLQKEKDVLVTKMHAAQERLDAAAKIENAAKTKAVTAAQTVNTLSTQRDTVAKKLNVTHTKLLTLANNALTKALHALKAAWETNPIGLILMGVTMVAGALMTMGDAMESASEEVTRFGESAVKTMGNVDTLMAVINNTSQKSKVHNDAVDELCKIYEEFGIKIDDERDKLEQLNEMREEVIRLIKEEGEERQKANQIQSYEEAIKESTQEMRDELLKALKEAEWNGSGLFDDWDASEYQEQAKQLAIVIGDIIESEGEELAKLSGDAYEAKLKQINQKIEQAYKDLGLNITKEFSVADGTLVPFGTDVDEIGITERYADAIRGLVSHREELINSYQRSSEGANDEAEAVDYTTLSFDKLFDAAYHADEEITETKTNLQMLGGFTAKPLIDTSSLDNALNQTNSLINNLQFINGQPVMTFNSAGFQIPTLQLPEWYPFGIKNQRFGLSIDFPTSFTNTGNSEIVKAQNELENRLITAMKTRKGTADLLKEVNSALDTAESGSDDEKRLIALQKRLNTQKKKFDQAEGKNTHTESAEERRARIEKAELDIQRLLEESARAREQLQRDLALQAEQNSINLEEDASERRRRQLELDQAKEQDQLKRQQETAVKAEIARQKSYFDAVENAKAARNKKYVKKNFTEDDIDQTEIDRIIAQYQALFKQLEEQQKRGQVALMQVELESMRDYLKEYGSFEQQKLAITEDYEQRIKKEKTEGERLRLKKEKEKALSNMTFESISMGIDWPALLSGVGSLSHEMMKPLLEQLEAYTNTDEYAQADIQEREKVVELIQDLRQYIGTDKDAGWEDLATAIRDFSESVANYKELEKQEQATIAARENAKGQLQRGEITQEDFDRIDATANELGQKTADARDEMQELGKTLNETSKKVKNYVSPLTATLNKLETWEGLDGFSGVKSNVASFDKLKGALDSVLPNIGNGMAKTIGTNLSSALGSTLGSIGRGVTSLLSSGMGNIIGIVAQIPKLILDLVNAVKNMVTGVLDSITEIVSLRWIDDLVVSILDSVGSLIDAIFDLPENLYKVVESIVVNGVGGLLNTVLGRVGNILSFGFISSGGPADWFTNSNAKEVQETIDRLTERNELLQTAIEDLTDEIKSSKGTKSVSAYRDAYKLQEETNANYLQMAQAQAGYHGSHHSWNYYWGGFTQEQINRLSSQIGRSWNGDIWNLSPEEMKMLRTNVDMWQRIQGTGKGGYGGRLTEKLDDYIDQAGKLEELTDQLYEGLTGMSFDSMYDSFIDTLMDMDASTKDFADSISEYFMRAMLSNKIGELYSEKLEEWWNKFGKAMEDNELTETERNALQNEYMQYVDEAMKLRDEIAAATGYDSTSSAASQDSTKKGFTTASQDSIDELNGRFTAIQMDTSAIRETIAGINAAMTSMSFTSDEIRRHTDEIRNISLIAIDYLETISKNTNELYEMNDRLGKIEKNTRNL